MPFPQTLVCFPTYVGAIAGVSALEIGSRYVWVIRPSGERVRLQRSSFTLVELASTGHELAFKAAQIANKVATA